MHARKTENLIVRMTPEDKALIAMGARLSGQSISGLVISCTVKEVRALMEQEIRRQTELDALSVQKMGHDDQPIVNETEKLKFIADGLGVSADSVRNARGNKGKAAIRDFVKWSKQHRKEIEKRYGKIPKDEAALENYIASVKEDNP